MSAMKARLALLGGVALALCPFAVALDIEGVQAAAMDQPRVTVILRRSAEAAPLAAKGDPALAQLLGMDAEAAKNVAGFAAFLDTGASGISISTQTADGLGIRRLVAAGGKQMVFHDVGIGGLDQFNVGEPLLFSAGPYQALGLSPDQGSFKPLGGPWSPQIGPLGGGGLLGMLTGAIDVLGMPAMAGRVVIIDARPVNTFTDTLRVQLVDPRAEPNATYPPTQRHVRLSYGDFGPYTYSEPGGSTKPVSAPNPFIGRAPTLPADGRVAGITVRHEGRSAEGAWLLDTGAAASMISTAQAAKLGVRYKAGTESAAVPVLEGVPAEKQFTLAVGGIGGSKTAAGFYIDELRVPTAEQDDLVYKAAPVLVVDITVTHPETGKELTLDGVFGMNLLVASAQVTGGLMPDLGKMVEGPFDWIVIDHKNGVLGLGLRKELQQESKAR